MRLLAAVSAPLALLPALAAALAARSDIVPSFVPAAVGAASPALAAADGPSPTEITIQRVRTGGTGCPRRAVSTSISDDRTSVTLGFDEFQTGTGRGRRREDRDKQCRITMGLHYPSGYSFAVLEATYHGFAQLDSGVTGSFESGYSFVDDDDRPVAGEFRNGGGSGGGGGGARRKAPEGESVTLRSSVQGGGEWKNGKVYTKTDKVETSKVVRSPCGKNVRLVIRTRLDLTNSGNETAEGTLTGDDATFAFTQQVNIGWEKCT